MLDPNWKSRMQDGGGLALYNQGMSLLYQSGVLDVIESLGKPIVKWNEGNPQVLANQACRAAGFNDALYNLIHFRELHLDPVGVEMPKADFGGVDNLLATGDITKEEADAIRKGQSPNPSIYGKYLKPNTEG